MKPGIKNKERYVQKGESDEDWQLRIYEYDPVDYAPANRKLLTGETLINIPATRLVYNCIIRILELVVADLNLMILNGKHMPYRQVRKFAVDFFMLDFVDITLNSAMLAPCDQIFY